MNFRVSFPRTGGRKSGTSRTSGSPSGELHELPGLFKRTSRTSGSPSANALGTKKDARNRRRSLPAGPDDAGNADDHGSRLCMVVRLELETERDLVLPFSY